MVYITVTRFTAPDRPTAHYLEEMSRETEETECDKLTTFSPDFTICGVQIYSILVKTASKNSDRVEAT